MIIEYEMTDRYYAEVKQISVDESTSESSTTEVGITDCDSQFC